MLLFWIHCLWKLFVNYEMSFLWNVLIYEMSFLWNVCLWNVCLWNGWNFIKSATPWKSMSWIFFKFCTLIVFYKKTLNPKFQRSVTSGSWVMAFESFDLEAFFAPTSMFKSAVTFLFIKISRWFQRHFLTYYK